MSNERAAEKLAQAMAFALVSTNVTDGNGEPANVVDALDKMAEALENRGAANSRALTEALKDHDEAIREAADSIKGGLLAVARAIRGERS